MFNKRILCHNDCLRFVSALTQSDILFFDIILKFKSYVFIIMIVNSDHSSRQKNFDKLETIWMLVLLNLTFVKSVSSLMNFDVRKCIKIVILLIVHIYNAELIKWNCEIMMSCLASWYLVTYFIFINSQNNKINKKKQYSTSYCNFKFRTHLQEDSTTWKIKEFFDRFLIRIFRMFSFDSILQYWYASYANIEISCWQATQKEQFWRIDLSWSLLLKKSFSELNCSKWLFDKRFWHW